MERLRDLEQALGVVFRGVSHAGDGNIHLDVLRKGFADEGDEKQKVAAFEDKAARQLMSWAVPFPGNTVSARPARPCSPSIRIRWNWP